MIPSDRTMLLRILILIAIAGYIAGAIALIRSS